MKSMDLNAFVNQVNSIDENKKDWNARLIRHYTSEGFIDNPGKEGRKAYYNENHLNQVLKISELKKNGISLSKMKEDSENSYQSVSSLRESALRSLNENTQILQASSQSVFSSQVKSRNNTDVSFFQSVTGFSNGSNIVEFKKIILEDGLEINASEEKMTKAIKLINCFNKMEENK